MSVLTFSISSSQFSSFSSSSLISSVALGPSLSPWPSLLEDNAASLILILQNKLVHYKHTHTQTNYRKFNLPSHPHDNASDVKSCYSSSFHKLVPLLSPYIYFYLSHFYSFLYLCIYTEGCSSSEMEQRVLCTFIFPNQCIIYCYN